MGLSVATNLFAPLEFLIPRSRSETVVAHVMNAIAIAASALAVMNVFNREALLASALWFAFLSWVVWEVKEQGWRRFFVGWLGSLAGQRFAECAPTSPPFQEIRFGFRLFGYRFFEETVALPKIIAVQWSLGQASNRMGRDMNDWQVALWYHTGVPEIRHHQARRGFGRVEGQDVVVFGRDGRKADTEKFGLSFVEFLRQAGVTLEKQEGGTVFLPRQNASPS